MSNSTNLSTEYSLNAVYSYSDCFTMSNLVYTGPVLGYVANTPYLLSGYWNKFIQLRVLGILFSVFFALCACMSTLLFCIRKFKNNNVQSRTNWFMLIFNISNALIYIILTQIGWGQYVFFVAAVHNSTEILISLILLKKYFRSLFCHPLGYEVFFNLGLVCALLITLPHLIIVDFDLNSKIKLGGGIVDLGLFVVCLFALTRLTGEFIYKRCVKHEKISIPTRHIFMLLNLLAHTITVILSFLTCVIGSLQVIVILFGSTFMNVLGVIYFLVQINKVSKHIGALNDPEAILHRIETIQSNIEKMESNNEKLIAQIIEEPHTKIIREAIEKIKQASQ